MPLPRSLSNIKREITEKKWAEARKRAGRRISKRKFKMPESQRPDSFFFFFFFFFIHYSHATYGDHGEGIYSPFPVRCPRSGGTFQAPLCPPPRPVPRRCDAHQGNYKGKGEKRA